MCASSLVVDRADGSATRPLIGVLIVLAMIGLWVLGSASGAGPDEPSHLVRSAGVVRGDAVGDSLPGSPKLSFFEVPGWIAAEDPACYNFTPHRPADCLLTIEVPPGEVELSSRSSEYPVWGHLVPGVGTFFPAGLAPWVTRLLHGLIPAIVVGIALATRARSGWLAAGSTVLAITPMAWFLFAVVNPSGLVVAGGIGLWVALLGGTASSLDRHRWLVALSWAAMVLPRRDGMIWAATIVAIALLAAGATLPAWLRAIGTGPLVVVASTTGAMMIWAVRSDVSFSTPLLLMPLLPVAADILGRLWRAPGFRERWPRAMIVALAATGAAAVSFGIMLERPGGFDAAILHSIIGQTGLHLGEAVGNLGWLDTPVPRSMIFLWFLGLGLVAAASVGRGDTRVLGTAIGTIVTALLLSWAVSMVVSDEFGAYWQGRYYLPILVGVPIVLGDVRLTGLDTARLGRATALIALVVNSAAFAAAMRRWGVGVDGTLYPWRWDTYGAPLPPLVLLTLFLLVSVGFWRWLDSACRASDLLREQAVSVSAG